MNDEASQVWTIKVRHNPSHAVLADVEHVGEHIRLVAVRPLNGRMPDVGHLVGAFFPDLKAVRLALVAAMKGVVGDTLDNVLLSDHAYAAWQKKATEAVARLASRGVQLDSEAIPDERAKPLPDGRLLIWVDIPGFERVELVVPKKDWAWRVRPN